MTRKAQSEISLDDAYRLSFGDRSSSRSGSRQVPHRLNRYERILLERSREQGMLYQLSALRVALLNSYFNFCIAAGRPYVVLSGKPETGIVLTVIDICQPIAAIDPERNKFGIESHLVRTSLQQALTAIELPSLPDSEVKLLIEDAHKFFSAFRHSFLNSCGVCEL